VGPFWDVFKQFLLDSLKFFYGGVGDYGVAIILLTVAMRVILTPLTWKQTKSMYELQQVQPKIKALQDKYKNDKEKQQEELMKFYQENKVNPFGGCLPLLLQMPLFIALYQVLGGPAKDTGPNFAKLLLSYAPALREAAKRFWIILPDLSKTPALIYAQFAKDGGVAGGILHSLPYVIMVVLFGLSTWLPQYLMTKDPQQRRTGTYMAVFMLYIGWISPAGVLLYWVTSSAWQVGQQIITQRILARREGA
jgi:YidC/Oxa1 family membrane protein insertase